MYPIQPPSQAPNAKRHSHTVTAVLAGLQHGLKPRGNLADINDDLEKMKVFQRKCHFQMISKANKDVAGDFPANDMYSCQSVK